MNDIAQTESLRPFRFQTPALVIGVIGLLASGAGAFMATEQFYRSWLVAFVFWTALTIGSLAILMLQYMTGGWWGYMIRRPLLAAVTNFPLVVLAAIPVWVGAEHLYLWMDHDLMEHDHILHQGLALSTVRLGVVHGRVAGIRQLALEDSVGPGPFFARCEISEPGWVVAFRKVLVEPSDELLTKCLLFTGQTIVHFVVLLEVGKCERS